MHSVSRAARRTALYGAAGVLGGALVWGGFFHDPGPCPDTLLGIAEVNLNVAGLMPARDQGGSPHAGREDLLRRAEEALAGVERAHPGLSVTMEMRAYLCYLRGEWSDAAGLYRRALEAGGVPPGRRARLVVHAAEMERQAGRPGEALDLLAGLEAEEGGFPPEGLVSRAAALESLGRRQDAVEVLLGMEPAPPGGDPSPMLACARALARLGEPALAMDRVERALPEAGAEGHHLLAALKLEAGDADTAFASLMEARRADPLQARRLLARDAWMQDRLEGHPRAEELWASEGTEGGPTGATGGRPVSSPLKEE